VQRDHYNVVRKQQLAEQGKDELARRIQPGTGAGEALARRYVEEHGAAVLLTTLDREAEYSADQAAEVYLARAGMNPIAFYSVLQKMVARGEQSAGLAALYKTHPPLTARLDRIDQRRYAGLEAFTYRP
jgi:predicted Zn-dependent protease